jgi:hypothetical protein
VAYAAGWGAIIPDDQLGPLAFLIPKAQKRPAVLQVPLYGGGLTWSLLQVVDVPLIENRQCELWHSRRGITVTESRLSNTLLLDGLWLLSQFCPSGKCLSVCGMRGDAGPRSDSTRRCCAPATRRGARWVCW